MQLVPLPGHTPGHTGYEFFVKGTKNPVLGRTLSIALRVQLQHPEVTCDFDIDQTAAAATRQQLLPKLASEDGLDRGAAYEFSCPGSLAQGREWV